MSEQVSNEPKHPGSGLGSPDAGEDGQPRVALHVGPWEDENVLGALSGAPVELVGPEQAEAAVWLDYDPASLGALLADHPHLRWIQLPMAGVESWLEAGVITGDRTFTCGRGVYGEGVAEHALALVLAGANHLHSHARATTWRRDLSGSIRDQEVLVVGAGGIGQPLIRALSCFDVTVTAVNRSGHPVEHADRTLPFELRGEVWGQAWGVVIAAPLTPETRGLVDADALARMRDDAWLVNVARGAHVDTDALVRALAEGWIGGAALDVTDPEPLPDDHPLWREPRCLLTSHTSNPPHLRLRSLGQRLADNARRYLAGEPLLGAVDPGRGY